MSETARIEALLVPIDPAAPAGPDLEYDPDFMALERLAQRREERQFGDNVIAAEEPDWAKVEQAALAAAERTRDLRVAIHLCAAWVRLRGLPGWSDGLALVRGLLEQHWDTVHPQLDAEDDNDPTARVTAIMPLADPFRPLGYLRTTVFVQSPRLGAYTLRDLRLATHAQKPAEGAEAEVASLADIESCCLDCNQEDLEVSVNAAREALDHARAVDALLDEHLGISAPELKPLMSDLMELDRFLQVQWSKRVGSKEQPESDGGAADTAGTSGPDETGVGTSVAQIGRITTPQDVIRRIDEICDYYARMEPSSPVPILLRRAQRLVGRSFEELLADLAPGGMGELRHLAGEEAAE